MAGTDEDNIPAASGSPDASLTQDDSKTKFVIQLDLNGFSRIGSNPLSLIKRSVPGYGKINDSSADRVFGAE